MIWQKVSEPTPRRTAGAGGKETLARSQWAGAPEHETSDAVNLVACESHIQRRQTSE